MRGMKKDKSERNHAKQDKASSHDLMFFSKVAHKKRIVFNLLMVLVILTIEIVIGFLFRILGLGEIHIFTIYVVGIIVTAQLTASRLCSVLSVLGIFIFNFFFAEPVYSFKAYYIGYPFTFIILLLTALMLGEMTAKSKQRAKALEETTLRIQNEKLRSNLLRSISHDLRTPLTGILGNAALLSQQGEKMSPEKRKAFSEDIWADSIHLIDMVENLLAITKMDEVKHSIKMQPELLDEILLDVVERERKLHPTYEILLEPATEMQVVKCNAQLMTQVMSNLLENAVKFSPEHTKVDVRSYSVNERVYIEVADEGKGIPDAIKEDVFTIFFTTSEESGDRKKGFGIGLALCREIIETHGGKIEIKDAEPHGTIVRFFLPLEQARDTEA